MDDVIEVKVPAIMLGVSTAVFVGYGAMYEGASGAGAMLVGVGLYLAIMVVLGLAACFVGAKLMSIGLGTVPTAALKLGAIFVTTAAITLVIPYFGWLIALIAYLTLLAALFDIEPREAFVLAVIIWGVRMGALFAVARLA